MSMGHVGARASLDYGILTLYVIDLMVVLRQCTCVCQAHVPFKLGAMLYAFVLVWLGFYGFVGGLVEADKFKEHCRKTVHGG